MVLALLGTAGAHTDRLAAVLHPRYLHWAPQLGPAGDVCWAARCCGPSINSAASAALTTLFASSAAPLPPPLKVRSKRDGG